MRPGFADKKLRPLQSKNNKNLINFKVTTYIALNIIINTKDYSYSNDKIK